MFGIKKLLTEIRDSLRVIAVILYNTNLETNKSVAQVPDDTDISSVYSIKKK